MKSLFQHTIYIFVTTILLFGQQSLSSQTIGLHVDPAHNVLFGDSLQGFGDKFIWTPEKGALRAGYSGRTTWNPDSIGFRSVAFGETNLVTANFGMSWGAGNKVKGPAGTAWGIQNNATGTHTTAWGGINIASGDFSTAWGAVNEAIGYYSTVWGTDNSANSINETVFGRNAIVSTPSSPETWSGDDQLLAIGNGASPSIRNNAFTILKNGNIGINTSSPRGSFDVKTTNGDVYLTDDTNGDIDNGSGSLYLPGHIFIAPFKNTTNIAYLQARRENTSGSTQLNIRTTQDGVISEAVQIKSDGDVDIKGFVKIGDTAPAVKYKTITLNTPNSAGFFSSAIHGLDQTKIIGMQASLVDGINTLFPNDRISTWRYNVRITDTQVRIEIELGSTITDKPVTVTLTYIE